MKNNIPQSVDPLISLGTIARFGAQTVGVAVGIKQNPEAAIATDLYDLVGDPATPLVPGKQEKYAAQKTVVKQAYAGRDLAVQNGIDYCRLAIGVLKPVLGYRWNNEWNTAGFVIPSLAVANDPLPMLAKFRAYFNANPAKEVAPINVTSAQAQLMITQIEQAHSALAQARTELIQRKGARDFALRKLRDRLSGLRAELDQILTAQDGRWYDFGFRRPADREIPDPVTGLVLTLGSAGMVLAEWENAPLADNYRVTWRLSGENTQVNQVDIVSGNQCTITGLPSGSIVVAVSARNSSGEAAPTEATIKLPSV